MTSYVLHDYLTLCKPKVVLLMLITAWVGMLLATELSLPWEALVYGSLGIALSAGSGAVFNHVVEQHLDIKMLRTRARPVAAGRVSTRQACIFATVLAISGMLLLTFLVNSLTAWLTLFSLIGYAFIYTLFLKHATPQNIVIGGLAGATPPLLGWTAVTGQFDPHALLLVLIVFTWTPPHFWALALYRRKEYAQVAIPMLPVTHGVSYTKLSIVLYTVLLILVTLLPFITGMSGYPYLVASLVLNAIFLWLCVHLYTRPLEKAALRLFGYSIFYLFMLFIVLLVDHYLWLFVG